jgi:hypothetical protein
MTTLYDNAAPMVRFVANWCLRQTLLGVDGETMLTRAFDAYGSKWAELAEQWLLETDIEWIAELQPLESAIIATWIADCYDFAGCESFGDCWQARLRQRQGDKI